ncbi:PrsW family glutamic-type intramembrane protease [Enterococcus ureasiticus]|uniref:PrsW family glutamic-type intramembrane protease n=1 Tax=Enterococcus ureasiticus TaxID=903984 RepID=UPI0009FF3BD9|nr:PrsW family glutamic-type intramembrane protease [Enterococcus ureasiticus]
MLKKISLFVFILLASIGISYELDSIGLSNLNNSAYLVLFLTLLLLCLYIVPGTLLLKKFSSYFTIPSYIIVLAIFGGAFIPGWLSAFGNEFGASLISNLFGNSTSITSWMDSLTAPVVEESTKFLCVLLIIYLLKIKKLPEVFGVGVSVGLGFQIMEDISYVANTASESIQDVVPQVIIRISGSISSHWSYTGILSLGIICLVTKNKNISRRDGYLWFISPIVLHFLWNSPINEFELNGIAIVSAILTTLTIIIVIQIINQLKSLNHDTLRNNQ